MMLFLAGGLALWLLAVFVVLSICRAAARADDNSSGRRIAEVSRRGATVGLAAAVVSLPALQDEASAQGGCANRDVEFEAAPPVVRDALACEIARIRARRDAGRVKTRKPLAAAAGGHSADMVARRYFAHVSPEGGELSDRVRTAGYAKRGCTWQVGEILAWGVGAKSTAIGLVKAWMNSPGHRRILVSNAYAHVGIGLQGGTPSEEHPNGVTATVVFGRRDCSS